MFDRILARYTPVYGLIESSSRSRLANDGLLYSCVTFIEICDAIANGEDSGVLLWYSDIERNRSLDILYCIIFFTFSSIAGHLLFERLVCGA